MGHFNDFPLFVILGPGSGSSQCMLGPDSHVASLCSRICCPSEAKILLGDGMVTFHNFSDLFYLFIFLFSFYEIFFIALYSI